MEIVRRLKPWGFFLRKAGFCNKWEHWVAGAWEIRDTRDRFCLLSNVVQGHSYLHVSLSSWSSKSTFMQIFFCKCSWFPAFLLTLKEEHWMWSQRAAVLMAALLPAGGEIRHLCFSLLFTESTGLLINTKGKILVIKKMYGIISNARNASSTN